MRVIVMKLYRKGNTVPIAPQTAMMDNVLPSLLSLDAWDTVMVDDMIVATERETGNEVHFTIEEVN